MERIEFRRTYLYKFSLSVYMFKYVGDISTIYQNIINGFIEKKLIAIDATLGNGYDTDFLSKIFNKVYAFDVQKEAILNYKEKNIENVSLILDSHENFDKYIKENVDCIVYNLGYLPGSDKSITTKKESTLKSLESGLNLLKENGLMIIALYSGHEEGKKEKKAVLSYCENLSKKKFGVIYQQFLNRTNNPPSLVIIEKK